MLTRLPKPQAILQVYAVIAVLFSAWTITAFLWKLSAWLLLLNLGEIFTIFSYAMLANLLESLIILSVLLAICMLLPPRFFRDEFAARGTILSIGLIGALMAYIGSTMTFGLESGAILFCAPLALLLLTIVFLSLSPRSRFMRAVHSSALWLSDRLTVFLFILVPLSLILSAYVIFRNMI